MKLIKIKPDHFIIVDDSEIKKGDWYYSTLSKDIQQCMGHGNYNRTSKLIYKKITRSTQPLEYTNEDHLHWDKIKQIYLSEVKELIGEVDLEKKAHDFIKGDEVIPFYTRVGFKLGYNQCLEDNKDKKYTEEQAKIIWKAGQEYWKTSGASITFEELTERIAKQPKTEWEVGFDENGKLKLKQQQP